ncbi:MAG: NUDIX hydrolase [Lachnospiraceae bacterium]|nr:NUDIX hydrolase [Lachnospiraceae bacterium]
MTDKELMWSVKGSEQILHTPIFDVEKRKEESATGISGEYMVINATEWVTIIPVYQGNFVLVRQYRHGLGKITAEFPGGMCEVGEDPLKSAYRELEEETGFKVGKMTVLGVCSPNPAIYSNSITVCLAEDLTPTNELHLDDDEVLTCELRPIEEVIENFCTGEYTNAFMGTALALYMRHVNRK